MINLEFSSDALPADTFQILEFSGEEQISQLFRFELRLVSRDPDIDFKSIMESSAFLAITTQDKTRYVHGMLSEFEQAGFSKVILEQDLSGRDRYVIARKSN